MRDARIAELVAESLHYRDGQVYRLVAFCIMPNHLHLVIVPLPTEDGAFHSLSAIMHSLKRYTARQANLLLGREGAFWQQESYDHVVRDEAEARRIIEYVLNNPVKAGLAQSWEDWPWNYVAQDAINLRCYPPKFVGRDAIPPYRLDRRAGCQPALQLRSRHHARTHPLRPRQPPSPLPNENRADLGRQVRRVPAARSRRCASSCRSRRWRR